MSASNHPHTPRGYPMNLPHEIRQPYFETSIADNVLAGQVPSQFPRPGRALTGQIHRVLNGTTVALKLFSRAIIILTAGILIVTTTAAVVDSDRRPSRAIQLLSVSTFVNSVASNHTPTEAGCNARNNCGPQKPNSSNPKVEAKCIAAGLSGGFQAGRVAATLTSPYDIPGIVVAGTVWFAGATWWCSGGWAYFSNSPQNPNEKYHGPKIRPPAAR